MSTNANLVLLSVAFISCLNLYPHGRPCEGALTRQADTVRIETRDCCSPEPAVAFDMVAAVRLIAPHGSWLAWTMSAWPSTMAQRREAVRDGVHRPAVLCLLE